MNYNILPNIPGLHTVYQDIINRLNSLRNIDGSNVFNTVAIFNDQINRNKTGKGYAFQFPACFLEMHQTNGNYIGEQITMADIIMTFRIANWELDSSTGYMDQNLNIFTIRDIVKKSFTGATASQCGAFQWNGEQQNYDHDNIYEHLMKFKFHYADIQAVPEIIGDQYYWIGGTAALHISVTYSSIWGTNIGITGSGVGFWYIENDFIVS